MTGVREGTVDCRIDRKVRTILAIGLAVICRDQDRMTQLSKIPLDRLRSPEGSYDEYIYHWVDTLQSWWPFPWKRISGTFSGCISILSEATKTQEI